MADAYHNWQNELEEIERVLVAVYDTHRHDIEKMHNVTRLKHLLHENLIERFSLMDELREAYHHLARDR